MHTPLQADPDPKVRERCAYRHSLLMGYTSSIPAVLRQLPTQPEQRRRDTLKTTGMYMATRWLVVKPGVDMCPPPLPPFLLTSLPSPLCFLPLPCSISSSLPYSSSLPLPFPPSFHPSLLLSPPTLSGP